LYRLIDFLDTLGTLVGKRAHGGTGEATCGRSCGFRANLRATARAGTHGLLLSIFARCYANGGSEGLAEFTAQPSGALMWCLERR
jgi:hypothetical protein